ncbi:hypothetical protein TVAG_490110 [Trichomonas vaginalis G3]|uniref:IPT/TIG domain-containing protein n=1 Tax=Trichomonas vaginalis (strain ATCC PRA-98 / G3) TaxID=412133 RepID=A2FB48_TRIV3|nr:hypothetical protein TVAGG3_0867910 [Trichomonas vaginalis G3]EAX97883.1 hypothetical protein TVAG_490110 [Trichomonas vaginalis G3]KAI5501162.1 hypothetical protein TVAGG3_0867910 [Trichomonas vaginalis G3]|eukprot:XP_001310813.1 hypothetical protein [Trichomonas vaginalis G3]
MAPAEYDDIYDDSSSDFRSAERHKISKHEDESEDSSTNIKLLSINPFRISSGKKTDIIFEIQPDTIKEGYGRFGETIVSCPSTSQPIIICQTPKLSPGEFQISFSIDNHTWTNSIPLFVYQTNFTFQIILTIILFGFGFGGLILAFIVMNGNMDPNLKSKKPAALSHNLRNADYL